MTVQVICDFDGTIAEKDMIAAIMRHFVYEETAPLIEDVYAGRLSVRDGVERMFSTIPSEKYQEVVDFAVRNTVVRPGFEQFIHSCGQLGWKVAIVSGGFDFFVHPVIHKLSTPVDIYCNHLNTDRPYMQVEWALPCDDRCEGGCGLCKPSVMRSRADAGAKFIVIGDGVTDFKAAREADYVYARAKLLEIAVEQQMPVTAFDTFYDITKHIEDRGAQLYAYIS